MRRMLVPLLAMLLTGAGDPPGWTRDIAPFRLIGPIDYVGSEGIAAYLIHTLAGAVQVSEPADNVMLFGAALSG